MSEYERRALREHAEHHYKEHHMSEDAKVILGAIILAPFLYFLLIVLMSF
jgi:hypothetical protein